MTDRPLTAESQRGPMSAEDRRLCEALERDLKEMDRVKLLTNEQLVEEILDKLPFTDMDCLFEEACTRLDPDWSTREKSLTERDEAMLKRVHEAGMARIREAMEKANG